VRRIRLDAERASAESAQEDPLPARHLARLAARFARGQSSAARPEGAARRAQNALDRRAIGAQRDIRAQSRDLAAAARDMAAGARDRLAELDPDDDPAAALRERARRDRRHAARDRAQAAADREHAAAELDALRRALAEALVDDLTGTFRRTAGGLVIGGEIDRAHRTKGKLVLVFVDVDALEADAGDPAGEELLIAVVSSMRANLRTYDPIVRFGSDEFICALSNATAALAANRFERIQATLARNRPGAAIRVALEELRPGDSLDDLVTRGDAALQSAA
jgi:diguanylate cyclase (GGDEF)-like protein